jgi:uncharacterized coiled-coil protein SlyX
MDQETLEQVQTKIAYLERANSDLSDVVFRQQLEIKALAARIQQVADSVESARSEQRHRPAEDERPPHY